MPASRSLEIDAAEDFAAAQALLPLVDATALPNLLRDKKALVSDFDGVLTDNTVHLDETGRETVRLSRGDGMGLSALRRSGVPVLVLSSEQNPVVQLRCEKLGIPAIQTKEAKGPVLQQWALEQGLSAEDVVYIGNDLNDLPAFACAGVALAVADAHPKVLVAADYIIPHSGGCGAVRAVAMQCSKKGEPMTNSIQVGAKTIGPGHPVYIIGEIGINHNGELKNAFGLIDAAALAGCDAVKFQKGRRSFACPRTNGTFAGTRLGAK